MGTLSTELGAALSLASGRPRVYADANLPARSVAFMRDDLGWDVFFVMEHDDLRRARDTHHFALARQMHRPLVTLDRDYNDDRRFPPTHSGGVIVFSAPDERALCLLLRRVDRLLLRPAGAPRATLPLDGRKLQVHFDWSPVRPSP